MKFVINSLVIILSLLFITGCNENTSNNNNNRGKWKPAFNVGDCIKAEDLEPWETPLIREIVTIGKYKYLYKAFYKGKVREESGYFVVIDGKFEKTNCPKELQ